MRVPSFPPPPEYLLSFFNCSPPKVCEVVSHCGFDFYFLTKDVKDFFLCLLATCISSLENGLLKSFAHFKNWVLCLFVVELSYLFW